MKKYAVHFSTYSKRGNIIRHNEVVLVQVNTNTPFPGYLQKYIDKRLGDEVSLITSIMDITTDAVYAQRLHQLSKTMFFKEVLTIQQAAPGQPILINNEPADA